MIVIKRTYASIYTIILSICIEVFPCSLQDVFNALLANCPEHAPVVQRFYKLSPAEGNHEAFTSSLQILLCSEMLMAVTRSEPHGFGFLMKK